MSEQLTIKNLYNHMDETIAKDIFEGATYPWEILPKISGFIKELGKNLPTDEYDQVGEDVWIAKSATVFQTAYIHGPAIIGKNAEEARRIPSADRRGDRECQEINFYRYAKKIWKNADGNSWILFIFQEMPM